MPSLPAPAPSTSVFVARDITKVYHMGEVDVNALRGASLELFEADVLLCDELTGALDIATGILVLDAIAQVNRELRTTSAVITHNAAVAAMADRVVTLSDGHIASERGNEHKVSASELNW